ncbi:hypothetical protein [Bradyrhizobium sp. USDA 4452]
MNASNQDRRVQFVLAAFDILFNKRDYAAERLRSPRYIQHSAHCARPGRAVRSRQGLARDAAL